MGEEKTASKSGATSSKIPRFDYIPMIGLIALARRYEKGVEKHGADNWRKALTDVDYVCERMGHVIDHAYKAIEKLRGRLPDDGDDDAGAIAWGGMFLAEAKAAMAQKRCPLCRGKFNESGYCPSCGYESRKD